jgi:predicted dienelactone hydrolase
LRPLESLAALFLFLTIIRYILPSRPRGLELLPLMTLLVCLLQVMMEGYRWQMLLIFAATLILFLFPLRSLFSNTNRSPVAAWKRLLGISLGLIFFMGALALPILLPIPVLPSPSGSYQVGTFSMMLTDNSRQELYSGNPSDPRRIMIQVWYPADPLPGDQASPWMERADLIGPAISRFFDLPPFFLDHLKYVRTGAFLDSPISQEQAAYPVLMFSHGWNGFRAQNTIQAVNFASNGYVVVAIDHTYGAVLTVFPDGQKVYNNPQALPEGVPDQQYLPIANKLVNQWAGDLGFVLDSLKTMNENDPIHGLTGRLDLEKLGVYGHSTGGGAAIEFCGRDPRCKAGLGMDAFMKPVSGTIRELGLRQPFLFMFSESWSGGKNWNLFNELYTNSDDIKVFTILGTSHYDFSDLPMLSPIAVQMGLKGPLDGERVMKIIGDYSLAFFNQVFHGKSTGLLDGHSENYPEVVFP